MLTGNGYLTKFFMADSYKLFNSERDAYDGYDRSILTSFSNKASVQAVAADENRCKLLHNYEVYGYAI